MKLFSRHLALSLILFYFSTLEANDAYKKGVILVQGKEAVLGEYTKTENGVFVRNDSVGRMITNEQLQGIVSEEYYFIIQKGSRSKAAWESLIYFDAGASYQWHSSKEKTEQEDFYIRIIKLSLVLTTGIFFWDAQQANNAVKNSYIGLSNNVEKKFDSSYRNYQIAGLLTLFTFSYSTINAHLRFGRNEQNEDLDIPARNLTRFSSFYQYRDTPNMIAKNNIEFSFIKTF
ncbi:hypothetical protein LEP1GSC195_1805 [Leptospira wolbachii serovar Codice str. CDC]|uniref:DUF481 domain-containing protein n=1 Tax=Leptospira wolbachii serovar Codice str. CDC TaxID=1218599 RepID=R9A4L0_9LEPT|nr:hypothetical protein [Leptospira wolbachii]EOQ97042.1 hypothetical protein LEP1GSC195_1805 [Leptospira wolbachii serovar Codice str. CDC]